MTDTAIGFALLGVALLVVLGIVFVIAARSGPARETPRPPRGVHLPGPSVLPFVVSFGGGLLGAGLAFRNDDQLANPFLAIPGLIVLVAGIAYWVKAANREWTDTEHGSHDDGAAH